MRLHSCWNIEEGRREVPEHANSSSGETCADDRDRRRSSVAGDECVFRREGDAIPIFHADAGKRNSGSSPCAAILAGFGVHGGSRRASGAHQCVAFSLPTELGELRFVFGTRKPGGFGTPRGLVRGRKPKTIGAGLCAFLSFLRVYGRRGICSGTNANLASEDARSVLILL